MLRTCEIKEQKIFHTFDLNLFLFQTNGGNVFTKFIFIDTNYA